MGYALRKSIIGVPVLSILMGMLITVIRPSLAESDGLKTGIKFTSRKILQWAVIILGFSLNLGTIAKMGGQSLPVIEADDEEVAQAISVIFLFNVIAAFIFPSFGHAIGFGSEGFAIFAGTAVNSQ